MQAQAQQMRLGLEETRRAADAAHDSAVTAAGAATVAERTLHLTERADVLVDKIELAVGHALHETHINLRLRNFGRTRADDVKVECHYGIKEIGIADGFNVGATNPPVPFALGAGADLKFRTRHTMGKLLGDL